MKRRHTYAAVLTAGLLTALGSASAASALADHSTTSTPPTTTTTAPPPGPAPFLIAPSSGLSGQTVTLTLNAGCEIVRFSSTVLAVDPVRAAPPYTQAWASATVHADSKPGTYDVTAVCLNGRPPRGQLFTARFTVIPNPTPARHQVTQVPVGAPQTGGGTAPQS